MRKKYVKYFCEYFLHANVNLSKFCIKVNTKNI